MIMATRVRTLALFYLICLCSGAGVTLGTYLLIGAAAGHLPGGSLSAGLMIGFYWKRYLHLPLWLLLLSGAITSVAGWACTLPFVH